VKLNCYLVSASALAYRKLKEGPRYDLANG
jgi:hypothetical protein